jgi:hypothetical protein
MRFNFYLILIEFQRSCAPRTILRDLVLGFAGEGVSILVLPLFLRGSP